MPAKQRESSPGRRGAGIAHPAHCRFCGRPVRWIHVPERSPLRVAVVDADPVYAWWFDGGVVGWRMGPGHVEHHQSCPALAETRLMRRMFNPADALDDLAQLEMVERVREEDRDDAFSVFSIPARAAIPDEDTVDDFLERAMTAASEAELQQVTLYALVLGPHALALVRRIAEIQRRRLAGPVSTVPPTQNTGASQ